MLSRFNVTVSVAEPTPVIPVPPKICRVLPNSTTCPTPLSVLKLNWNPVAVTSGLPLLNDNVNVPVLNVAPVTNESETDAALTVRSNADPELAITTELSDEL